MGWGDWGWGSKGAGGYGKGWAGEIGDLKGFGMAGNGRNPWNRGTLTGR